MIIAVNNVCMLLSSVCLTMDVLEDECKEKSSVCYTVSSDIIVEH